MSNVEVEQLELLARVDSLVERLVRWSEQDVPWEPYQRSRAVVRRMLTRIDELRVRIETPLVVATFGGTGTGKSTLVNALVGEEVTRSGRERPTTRRPVLITHRSIDPGRLGLPLEDFEVLQSDAGLLRDVVFVDCPDPDTSEGETTGSNLAILRDTLPHCDVLLYTSTQQKYRSARVVEELGQAATGQRLLFVQTRADVDEDVREDWRQRLAEHFAVPEVFFVDSLRALEEQRDGRRPSGDFGRLLDVLTTELAASERVRIRRANILDLVHDVLDRCRQMLQERRPDVGELERALDEQRQRLTATMSERLERELRDGRNLWERRLLSAVTERWGTSPFSTMLRVYNGLGGLLASLSFFRARSSVQFALLGAVQGARWLKAQQDERAAESSLEEVGRLGLDDDLLREVRTVVNGYVASAGVELEEGLGGGALAEFRDQAARTEDAFLGGAGQRVDELIDDLARRNSGWFVRGWYETLFLLFAGFLLFRIGKNFFYDNFWLGEEEVFGSTFFISAGILFVLWTGFLVVLFARRLRLGLDKRISALAEDLSRSRLSKGPFPQLDDTCERIRRTSERLDALLLDADDLRRDVTSSEKLGARLAREATPVLQPTSRPARPTADAPA